MLKVLLKLGTPDSTVPVEDKDEKKNHDLDNSNTDEIPGKDDTTENDVNDGLNQNEPPGNKDDSETIVEEDGDDIHNSEYGFELED